jgi:hypothetical protein
MYYQHVTKATGTNGPGVRVKLLVAPISWFNVIQQPSNAGLVAGDTIVISTAHTFTVSTPLKGFVEFYTTPRTASAMLEMVGEYDSQGINATYEAFAPGVNIPLLEMMSQEDEFMLLIGDPDCDVQRFLQFGTRCSPAKMSGWKWESGKQGGEGKRGMTMKFDWYNTKPLIYTATPTLAAQS